MNELDQQDTGQFNGSLDPFLEVSRYCPKCINYRILHQFFALTTENKSHNFASIVLTVRFSTNQKVTINFIVPRHSIHSVQTHTHLTQNF